MIFITGAEGAGKRTFAESLGYTPADMADAEGLRAALEDPSACRTLPRVVYHAEKLASDRDDVSAPTELLSGCEVVIANEVGCGVIPADPQLNIWREAAGRLSIQLAKRADTVVRVVCGIPSVIKGTL